MNKSYVITILEKLGYAKEAKLYKSKNHISTKTLNVVIRTLQGQKEILSKAEKTSFQKLKEAAEAAADASIKEGKEKDQATLNAKELTAQKEKREAAKKQQQEEDAKKAWEALPEEEKAKRNEVRNRRKEEAEAQGPIGAIDAKRAQDKEKELESFKEAAQKKRMQAGAPKGSSADASAKRMNDAVQSDVDAANEASRQKDLTQAAQRELATGKAGEAWQLDNEIADHTNKSATLRDEAREHEFAHRQHTAAGKHEEAATEKKLAEAKHGAADLEDKNIKEKQNKVNRLKLGSSGHAKVVEAIDRKNKIDATNLENSPKLTHENRLKAREESAKAAERGEAKRFSLIPDAANPKTRYSDSETYLNSDGSDNSKMDPKANRAANEKVDTSNKIPVRKVMGEYVRQTNRYVDIPVKDEITGKPVMDQETGKPLTKKYKMPVFQRAEHTFHHIGGKWVHQKAEWSGKGLNPREGRKIEDVEEDPLMTQRDGMREKGFTNYDKKSKTRRLSNNNSRQIVRNADGTTKVRHDRYFLGRSKDHEDHMSAKDSGALVLPIVRNDEYSKKDETKFIPKKDDDKTGRKKFVPGLALNPGKSVFAGKSKANAMEDKNISRIDTGANQSGTRDIDDYMDAIHAGDKGVHDELNLRNHDVDAHANDLAAHESTKNQIAGWQSKIDSGEINVPQGPKAPTTPSTSQLTSSQISGLNKK